MNTPGRNGGTLHSFEKGQSGNRAGRPRGRGTISQIMKELGDFSDLELTVMVTDPQGNTTRQHMQYSVDGEDTIFQIMAIQIISRALKGNINAFKILLDRTEGRLPKPIRQAAEVDEPALLPVMDRTVEELLYEREQVRARLTKASAAE